MSTSPTSHRSSRRTAVTQIDLVCLSIAAVALLMFLTSMLNAADSKKKRSVCAANLRGLGQSQHIYANDNREWFPVHFVTPIHKKDAIPPEHGVTWVGMMGTSDAITITKDTTKDYNPASSHPSRSLFLLVIQGQSTPKQFICPSSGDKEDNLRNSGPDISSTAGDVTQQAAQPGINRFDFLGYESLSYGYQLPYGRKGRPRENLDSRMPVMADKGPFYESAGEGLAGTKTTRDQRSAIKAPNWTDKTLDELPELGKDWEPYNSRSHKGEGQNALFVDGHVRFEKTPVFGVNRDNLYTVQGSLTDPISALLGIIPAVDQTYGPLTETDSFIVP